MLFLPDDDLFINKFVYVEVPTKHQIFARAGQKAVNPAGSYTGDDSAIFGKTPTQSADDFVSAAETIVVPVDKK